MKIVLADDHKIIRDGLRAILDRHPGMEVVETFVRSTGQKIPVHVVPRRPGDVAEMFADTSLAQRVLGWSPSRNLERMCIDAWKWQTRVC